MTKEKNPGEIIRTALFKMLETGLVEKVLAFACGLDEKDIRPILIEDKKDVSRIVLTSYYPYNLSRLLKNYLGKGVKIGLVVRSCDARACVELAKRNQVNIDNIYLIGIECSGVADPASSPEMAGDLYIFSKEMIAGGEKKPIDEKLIRSNCLRCEYPVPSMADISCRITPEKTFVTVNSKKGEEIIAAAEIIAEQEESPSREQLKERADQYQEKDFSSLKEMKPDDRLNYWLKQFDKCIKCYGCRNACPICYCKDCYLEADRILVKRGELPPERMFHLTRLAHVADSCINCGMCESVCPMEIPLSRLYHMLYKELSTVFKYEAGLDPKSPPPLGSITEEELTQGGVDID